MRLRVAKRFLGHADRLRRMRISTWRKAHDKVARWQTKWFYRNEAMQEASRHWPLRWVSVDEFIVRDDGEAK